MKRLLIIIALCCSYSANAQWVMQNIGYMFAGVPSNQIILVDQNVVWTASLFSSPKYFSKTNDMGNTWIADSIHLGEYYTDYYISCISAVNFQKAWATLYKWISYNESDTKLFKTIDGGQTWQQQFPGLNSIEYVHFWNENEGFAYTQAYGRLQVSNTIDGGANWVRVDSLTLPSLWLNEKINSGFNGCSCFENILYIPTSASRILRSFDKGYHWEVISTSILPEGPPLRPILKDSLHSLLYFPNSQNTRLFETDDGGYNWSNINVTGPICTYIAWVPSTYNTVVSVGRYTSPYSLSYSFDGGHTWTGWDTLTNETFHCTAWYSNTCGWAGSVTKLPDPPNSGIYKYTGTLVDILKIDPRQGGIKLWPNPSLGRMNLLTVGFEGKELNVVVYNLLGQAVYSKKFHQDIIQLEQKLDLSFLRPGTYLVEVTCGDKKYVEQVMIEH